MTNEAKQKVSGATEVAKAWGGGTLHRSCHQNVCMQAQFASMSKGMAGFFKK